MSERDDLLRLIELAKSEGDTQLELKALRKLDTLGEEPGFIDKAVGVTVFASSSTVRRPSFIVK